MKVIQILKVSLAIFILVGGLFGCATTSSQTTVDEPKIVETNVDKEPVAPKPTPKPPVEEVIAGMERIHFDFDQFTLSAEARQVLGQNAKYLKANADVKVVIEGHCDDRGSDEYNLALGESRALAAKSYLEDMGISASRLSVISYGEEKPLDKSSGEAAWAQNRRAEFKAVR